MDVIHGHGRIGPAEVLAEEWIVLDPARCSLQRLPVILDVSHGGELRLDHPETAFAIYRDALVTTRSDLVILPRDEANHVVWEKFFVPNMSKTCPLDRNVENYDRTLRTTGIDFWIPAEIKHVPTAVSLLGATAGHWAHFIAEYLTRLVLTMRHLPPMEVAILVPANLDPNCRDLVESVLGMYSGATIMFVEEWHTVQCDRLFMASKGTYLCDDGETVSPFDVVVRHWASETISQALTSAMAHLDVEPPRGSRRKFYFPRSHGMRVSTNSAGIESLMVEAGYEVVNPEKLSLAEKIALFGRASHLAMIMGSAGFNCLFCPSDTKVLSISPYLRAHDHLGSTLRSDMDFFVVPGVDNGVGAHTSFAIDPNRVRTAMDVFGF